MLQKCRCGSTDFYQYSDWLCKECLKEYNNKYRQKMRDELKQTANNHKKYWSEWEKQYVKDLYLAGVPQNVIAREMGRSYGSIARIARMVRECII